MSWGDFRVPKGYRHHHFDDELLSELEQKCKDSQITTIIPDIDMYKFGPRQLAELAFKRAEDLGRKFFFFHSWFMSEATWDSQRKWYFFAPRDYKSPNSSRSNRTTGEGFWKITGKDRAIKAPGSKVVIGKKRTLTFHKRRVPKAQRTGWIIHEYYLIQEHGEQIGKFVVCCLKYMSDDSVHDEDAPFYNRGSSSSSMATNVENQAQGNWVSQELVDVVRTPSGNDSVAETGGSCSMTTNVENQTEENWGSQEPVNVDPIPNGNEAETVGGMITEEEEYLAFKKLADALQVPIGNLQEFKGTEQNDQSTSVEDRPDRSNWSDMIDELLDDPENLDSLFHPPAPPQPHQLHQSPMNTTNVEDSASKPLEEAEDNLVFKQLRDLPFESDDNDQELRGSQTGPCSIDKSDLSASVEGQTDGYNSPHVEMVEELHHKPGDLASLLPSPSPEVLQSPIYPDTGTNSFLDDEYRKRKNPFGDTDPVLTKKNHTDEVDSNTSSDSENQAAYPVPEGNSLPSINREPGDLPIDNNFIEWDDLPSIIEGFVFSPELRYSY